LNDELFSFAGPAGGCCLSFHNCLR
jgi:hypothetical protein